MDSVAAKDLGCLLGGYYKLLVDPSVCVFRLGHPKVRVHRIPAEEGVCGRFAVIEGVCYESLSSEQLLFHLNCLFLAAFYDCLYTIVISTTWIRREKTLIFYHHCTNLFSQWTN